MRTKILFTAGGSPGQQIVFELLSKKYDVFFADVDINKIYPGIPKTHQFQIPSVQENNYLQEIVKCCETNSINLLVPGIDEELCLILENKNLFKKTNIFLPSIGFVNLMLNKEHMNKAFREKGISVPKSENSKSFDGQFEFPIILKPITGRGSRDVYTVETRRKLKHLIFAFQDNDIDWLVQEKEIGEEYTVQVLATPTSELLGVFPIRVFEKRGSTTFAEMHHCDEIIKYCHQIHNAFMPTGCYNVQLIKRKNGKISCFEINPRISTTFCMVLKAGYDPFKYFLDSWDGSVIDSDITYKVPTISLNRHWKNSLEVRKL